jgi:hypothetical protein
MREVADQRQPVLKGLKNGIGPRRYLTLLGLTDIEEVNVLLGDAVGRIVGYSMGYYLIYMYVVSFKEPLRT